MYKRGQVTIFLILGVLLLVLLGSLTLLTDRQRGIIVNSDVDESGIQGFVQSCFDQALRTGVALTFGQGWHYETRDLYVVPQIRSISRDRGEGLVRTRPLTQEHLSQSLGLFMQEGFFICLDDLKEFPEVETIPQAAFSFDYGQQSIIATMNFPVAYSIDGKTHKLNIQKSSTPASVPKLHEVIDDVISASIQHNGVPTDIITQHINDGVHIQIGFGPGEFSEEVYYAFSLPGEPISLFKIEYNWY